MAEKLTMYNAGLRAANRHIVDEEPGYICPLCLDIVRSPSALTQEHVPPRAVGGKVLCLLCKNCNNRAGQSVDAAMAERVAAKKILTEGTTRKFVDLRIDDLSVKAAFRREGTQGELRIAKNHNSPANLDEFNRRIRAPQPATTLQVWYPHQFNDHFAMVGYLKAAYLYAFAKFGYSYVLRDCMDLVREQILAPKRKVIWKWWLSRREEVGQAKFYLCDMPINCLAVGIFDHLIVLPGFEEPHDQYEQIRAMTEGTSPDHLAGVFQFRDSFAVPTRMELLYDAVDVDCERQQSDVSNSDAQADITLESDA